MRTGFLRLPAALLTALVVILLGILGYAWDRADRQRAGHLTLAQRTFDVMEEPAPSMEMAPVSIREPAVRAAALPAIAVTVPRIAYTYGYSFRIAESGIAAIQERHLALCRRLGPVRCRVVSMRRGARADEGEASAAALSLQVAAPLAEAFGRALTAISRGGGADTVDRRISAEDLSRQMIDSAARIRTRQTLIRRLTGLLETRSGNIAQAVEAERAINSAQEELEAAEAALADMSGRVAMSAVEIDYQARAAATPTPANPLAEAFGEVGGISANSLAAMNLILGVAAPWAILAGALLLLFRLFRRRQVLEEEPEIAAVE